MNLPILPSIHDTKQTHKISKRFDYSNPLIRLLFHVKLNYFCTYLELSERLFSALVWLEIQRAPCSPD
jgi:hypothetical protein